MASPEDEKGAQAPGGEIPPPAEMDPPGQGAGEAPTPQAPVVEAPAVNDNGGSQTDPSYEYYEDPYAYPDSSPPVETAAKPEPQPETGMVVAAPAALTATGGSQPPPPPPPPTEPEDEEEDGMLRMSFLGHLEELRMRLLMMLAGVGVAFVLSLAFANQLWLIVSEPAVEALKQLGFKNPSLTQISPMETFNIVWVKLPILTATFISSPWILYQVWGFIAPGLYKRERRWVVPFVVCSAGLFISGGLFAYFVAFRFGLTFLLGIGRGINITPMVSVTEYFDLFVNVILGVAIVFELPVLIFFLTLFRIVTPGFLIRNSRYAILVIVVLAAIVTPTPDVVNLMMFATPMCILFYVGVLGSYLLILKRENRSFPWSKVIYGLLIAMVAIAGLVYLAMTKYGYHVVPHWPFLTR